MINNEILRGELTKVEDYALSAQNFMRVAFQSHFEWTVDGWVEQYIESGADSEEQAALQWMQEHYVSISAAVRATENLAEIIAERISDLWFEVGRIIREEKAAGETKDEKPPQREVAQ